MENVSLISGQVTLYERVNPFLIDLDPKERIITDDGYRPVCAGKYSLVWQGDTVTLSVITSANKDRKAPGGGRSWTRAADDAAICA